MDIQLFDFHICILQKEEKRKDIMATEQWSLRSLKVFLSLGLFSYAFETSSIKYIEHLESRYP